jgi:hypothetical protein
MPDGIDKAKNPNSSSGADYTSTGITISAEPSGLGVVDVFVNGSSVEVGDGTRGSNSTVYTKKACYFSSDGGSTAKSFGNIRAADTLYWNAAQAGYNLVHDTTVVDLVYAPVETWLDKFRHRAIFRLQLALGQYSIFFDDFSGAGEIGWTGFGAQTTFIGGVANAGGSSTPLFTPNTIAKSDGKWYVAARFKYGASVTSPSRFLIGLSNGVIASKIVVAGVDGNNSTAYYMGRFEDAVGSPPRQYLTSSIAVSAGFHDFEMWYDGSQIGISFDDETPITATPTHLASATYMNACVVADSTNYTVALMDKYLCLAGLP